LPRRGEVWWVRLDPTLGSEIAKTRPGVIISNDIINERRKTVVVVPLSNSPKPSPPILTPVSCNDRDAVAVIDQIRAISKERLIRCIGTLSPTHMEAIEQGIRDVLEFGY
jgi:mRNA interferase MazF